jgi:hypothetical protein
MRYNRSFGYSSTGPMWSIEANLFGTGRAVTIPPAEARRLIDALSRGVDSRTSSYGSGRRLVANANHDQGHSALTVSLSALALISPRLYERIGFN